MKILHLELNAGAKQHALCRMLATLGEYKELGWYPHWVTGRLAEFQKFLLDYCRHLKPDVIFAQLQTAGILTSRVAMDLQPAFIINWTGDVREPTPAWFNQLAPHIGATCFSNMTDVDNLRRAGHRAEYLQIGYDERVYTPDGDIGDWTEIVFLGADYGDRFPGGAERRRMVEVLRRRYGSRFAVYGPGFSDHSLEPAREAECYRSCKVAVYQGHFNQHCRYFSDRLLRILGCGAYCVAQAYPETEKDWVNGVHLDLWRSVEELTGLIDRAFDDPERRKIIGEFGNHEARTAHTWDARAQDIQRIVGVTEPALDTAERTA